MLTKSEPNVEVSITQAHRQELAKSLGLLLADTYALYLNTQNFHWNVKGVRFPELHLMFETQYRELADAVDLIAERIRALGYLAPATFSDFSKMTSIEAGDSALPAAEMIHKLMRDHERISQSARAMLHKAEQLHDHVTVDLFTERMKAHEKTAWMLRSSMEE